MHYCLLRAYVFRAQTQEIKERGGNQSTGIDFFITQERVIFLDTQASETHCNYYRHAKKRLIKIFLFLQPILSPSILDHLINNDRKLPPEYNLPHTYVEMQVSVWQHSYSALIPNVSSSVCSQPRVSDLYLKTSFQQSLQIAAFLFTVCHVVIVVQDWFTDLNLYRLVPSNSCLISSCSLLVFAK